MNIREDYSAYIKASLAGGLRAAFSMPLEHPFVCVRTKWQANPSNPTASSIIKLILSEKGLWGFYSGAGPNTFRVAIKQSYRTPMLAALPSFYKKVLPQSIQDKVPSCEELATGLTIANVEGLIITPLERLKTILITSKNTKGVALQFFKQNPSDLFRESYRGLRASLVRQNVAWISYQTSNDWMKKKVKHLTGKEQLSPTMLIAIGMATGIVNVTTVSPFDYLRTHFQKKENPLPRNMGILRALIQIKNEKGFKVFYTGWRVYSLHYMINATITTLLVEQIKRQFEAKNR